MLRLPSQTRQWSRLKPTVIVVDKPNSVEIGAYIKPSWVLFFRSNYGLGSHYFYGFEKNEFKRFGGERMNKLRILSQKFLAVKQALHSIISLTD